MHTGYDVEANTNWYVFLPSVAINTMSERYSIGGCITRKTEEKLDGRYKEGHERKKPK